MAANQTAAISNTLRAIAIVITAVLDDGAAHNAAERSFYTPSAKATMWHWQLLRSLQNTTMLCFAIEGSIS